MPPRKFFYGDVVEVDSKRYEDHQAHHAMVTSTHINKKDGKRWPRVAYEVACQCGTTLRPQASSMNLSYRPPSPARENIMRWQAKVFLDSVHHAKRWTWPIPSIASPYDHTEQAYKLIAGLNEKENFILTQRFGLEGVSGKTYVEIGDALDLSRERIRQIEKEALGKL